MSAVELGLGTYNSTYRVDIGAARPVVLRVAPAPARQSRAERELMRIAADHDDAGLDAADVRAVLVGAHQDRGLLDEITEPRLLHGDLPSGRVPNETRSGKPMERWPHPQRRAPGALLPGS